MVPRLPGTTLWCQNYKTLSANPTGPSLRVAQSYYKETDSVPLLFKIRGPFQTCCHLVMSFVVVEGAGQVLEGGSSGHGAAPGIGLTGLPAFGVYIADTQFPWSV